MNVNTMVIRSVREEDLEELYRLASQVYFINLPAEREILKEKIRLSIRSFSGEEPDKFAREYIFVLENTKDGALLGSSMIIARHGSPAVPHMYLELRTIQKYSETIHSGFIHKVLRLRFDEDGPTEIGGLVVDPNYRSHKGKLGRQLSFSRFLFMKMKRRWFKNYILSELMPPLTEDGESILWEALGRRFTNLSYPEADILSRKNKEFVTSLFPTGDIYTCLLSGEARDAIGKVGPGAEPVKHMLEKIGFKWREHIDPFDGGPHYLAETDKITIVQATKKFSVNKEATKKKPKELGLVGAYQDGAFRCAQTSYEIARGKVILPRPTLELLKLEPRQEVFMMPLAETSQNAEHDKVDEEA